MGLAEGENGRSRLQAGLAGRVNGGPCVAVELHQRHVVARADVHHLAGVDPAVGAAGADGEILLDGHVAGGEDVACRINDEAAAGRHGHGALAVSLDALLLVVADDEGDVARIGVRNEAGIGGRHLSAGGNGAGINADDAIPELGLLEDARCKSESKRDHRSKPQIHAILKQSVAVPVEHFLTAASANNKLSGAYPSRSAGTDTTLQQRRRGPGSSKSRSARGFPRGPIL